MEQSLEDFLDEGKCTGITAHSKAVFPGFLFVVRKGQAFDGGAFIGEAVEKGALAILTDHFLEEWKGKVSQIVVRDLEKQLGEIAKQFYQDSASKLAITGITGTNGKTTTAFLLSHLLETLGLPTGMVGTVEVRLGKKSFPATMTTPDIFTNYEYLHEMEKSGCKAAVFEVTSHALAQGRVDGIEFKTAVFTNFTQDHLDYHHSMEAYGEAKKLLFQRLKEGSFAVLNREEPMSVKMAEATKACLFWYGFSEGCDLLVKQYAFVDGGTKLTLQYNGERVSFLFPLMGRFNIYNCLAAMSAALTYGHSLVDVARAASQFSSVPGRLQAISNNLGLQIFVDFAHSEDALKNILKTLQETAKARIITLFGCGGDRDRKKRPLMARAAEHYSTFCVVTSDNPRSENPASIAEEIRKGFLHPERHKVELDREKAIELALTLGEPGDTVVLAGKGHEPYQIFATHTRPFSDATVAKELCQKLEGTRCR